MQISTDFSTRTLVAIAITTLSITCALTTFILYRTYLHEINQLVHRLFENVRCLLIPTYIEHPGSAFYPNPRLYPQPKTPYHYVASPFREWEGPLTFPPLFESQSTGLSSPTNEQDIGQEGGHILHEEYEEIPSILDSILPEEGVYDVTTPRASLSYLSSPEFHLREPRIPVVIHTDSEEDYRPYSPTNSEYATWCQEHYNQPTCPTLRPSTPYPPSNIRRVATASHDTAAREELARLTACNNKIERSIAHDRIIAGFYQRASHPQMERETATQYWQRQTASCTEADTINEVKTETYHQHPLHEPVWLKRYQQYCTIRIEQGLPGVSIATWMEQQAQTGDVNPRRVRVRVHEYLAFQESAYNDRSDLDAFGGGSGMEASGSSRAGGHS
ncbi:hypothetical protein EV421DRAFT_1732174 [Armillaria borealis]|uniref:Uncharacterized protein n=1 Tax=Armillaria borealis TaxID=47425 RepID=A0AA39JVZ4_9AGAR|nr:hypothetical protein EV421DRAFT_1732174 [Armillaria borealis]